MIASDPLSEENKWRWWRGVSLTEGEEKMVLMKMVLSPLMEEDGGGEGSLGSWWREWLTRGDSMGQQLQEEVACWMVITRDRGAVKELEEGTT